MPHVAGPLTAPSAARCDAPQLHGQNFWITARGDGLFKGYQPNFTHTARDTASVAANGHLVFRYAARNRGLWLMHCHIEWHMASGLGMIWKVGL